jgi:hypothetical protein
MPKTPPTIVAPLPSSPRVLALAKAVGISKREAFAAAAEAWAWMAVEAVDDIVPQTEPDALDSVVDIAGFGQAMLQAGLVGVVNDGLVLPAELRRQQRDERGGGAAAAHGGQGDAEQDARRKAQNADAARRYRRKKNLTGSKPKPTTETAWRSLGRVAGHEVRVFDGQFGVYAMVLGATIGGEQFKKLTTGDKSWSLDTVTLVDVLPGLVDKWKTIHQKERKAFAPRPLSPTFADLAEDADRAMTLARLRKLTAGEPAAHHADDDDASCRHADASSSVIIPSSSPEADAAPKSSDSTGLDASLASSFRHADGVSSMSYLSKSSSIEEDKSGGDREAAGIEDADQRERWNRMADRFAEALGQTRETILDWWNNHKPFLRMKLEQAGIDPTTGLPAEAHHEPSDARGDAGVTTEPNAGHEPAAGSVDARDDVARREDEDPDHPRHDPLETLAALKRNGIPLPTPKSAPGRGHRLEDIDLEREDQTSLVTARGLA